jgi:hypothetical protein
LPGEPRRGTGRREGGVMDEGCLSFLTGAAIVVAVIVIGLLALTV